MKLKRVTGNMESRLNVFPRKEDLEHQQCEVKIKILTSVDYFGYYC